jgi:transposase
MKKRQQEEMLPLLKRHEIQVLRRAGHTQEEVARIAGVSKRAVRRVEREAEVSHVDDKAEIRARGVGRPSKTESFRPLVEKLLADEPGLITLEILRRARLAGYTGSKTAMYALVARLRPTEARPVVRFEGVPGEFAQHDFGHVDVRFVDGRVKRVHFFASRLKYSRWSQVTLVPNESVEPLVRALVQHYAAFGGVPLVSVFDRPKTIALKWRDDGTVTEWNATFAQVMLELGVGVELCWPGRGNQKGSVESLVKWVKGSFFKPRRFVDDADLARQLADWHVEVNTRRPSRATDVIPETRLAEEHARLRPLRVAPADLALRYPVVVGPTGNVDFDGVPYSMPPEAIGLSGTLYLHQDRVRICAGRFEATHARGERGDKRILPEHRAEMLAAVSGKRAKRYYKREQILALGPVAVSYLTEIVHRRPKTWARDVDVMFELLQQYGEEDMRVALERALGARAYGGEYVRRFMHPDAPASFFEDDEEPACHPELGAPAGGIRLPIARASAEPSRAAEGHVAPGATRSRAQQRAHASDEHGEDGEDATLPEASATASSSSRWATTHTRRRDLGPQLMLPLSARSHRRGGVS